MDWGLLLRAIPLRTGMGGQSECFLSLVRSPASWLATWSRHNTCAPQLAETRENSLGSHKLRSQDVKQGKRRISASCCGFFICDLQQSLSKQDADPVRSVNSPVCGTSSNNRLIGPMQVFYSDFPLYDKGVERQKQRKTMTICGRKGSHQKQEYSESTRVARPQELAYTNVSPANLNLEREKDCRGGKSFTSTLLGFLVGPEN